jgi:monoamine oxidase
MIRTDVLIIGAGLTGLSLAYFLRKTGLSVHLAEARDRIGGRIYTAGSSQGPPVEMGATWLGRKHTRLISLLQELELDIFPQELGGRAIYEAMSSSPWQLVTLPDNDEPSFRIRGGSEALILALARHIPAETLHTGKEVRNIHFDGEQCRVECSDETFEAGFVVSTIPPYLFGKTVKVVPGLSAELQELLSRTHTWMGESIKFGLTYGEPFWRAEGFSGTLFSNVGPVSEMYDHSDFDDRSYALKGFVNPSFFPLSMEERRNRVLEQLQKYYGRRVFDFVDYREVVWSRERYTFKPYDGYMLPHQNNGHELYRQDFADGRLFLAGSETAAEFPGYMDGAVRSAEWVLSRILTRI